MSYVKATKLIQLLRDDGYTVYAKHVRYFPKVGLLEQETPEVVVDQYLSRGEWNRGIEANRIVTLTDVESMTYGDNVSPTGGFTKIEIYKDSQLISSGKRNFTKQQFNKRVGLEDALEVAMGKM